MSNVTQITTYDFYESAFYLTRGFDLEKIDIVLELGQEKIRMHFSGIGLGKAQSDYLRSKADVNLFNFRRSYQRLQSMIFAEKKRRKQEESI